MTNFAETARRRKFPLEKKSPEFLFNWTQFFSRDFSEDFSFPGTCFPVNTHEKFVKTSFFNS